MKLSNDAGTKEAIVRTIVSKSRQNSRLQFTRLVCFVLVLGANNDKVKEVGENNEAIIFPITPITSHPVLWHVVTNYYLVTDCQEWAGVK
jgi:hypothetical protein